MSVPGVKPVSGPWCLVLVGETNNQGNPPQAPVLSFKNIGKSETGFALMTKEIHRLIGSSPAASTQKKDEPTNEMQVTELPRDRLMIPCSKCRRTSAKWSRSGATLSSLTGDACWDGWTIAGLD